ncbi:MAG: putative ubiquitin-protein ligase [Olpidium bornovanus]|uniref:HECT-type E3 ubiquitin transferase n=1 Tax=Olpidium bornovanus TaxID=278681 RepID=A0A8H7ZRV9_9FUNG|nr:MAG: putative ubiquitin-protein ligase [Olpidium bornovanus]
MGIDITFLEALPEEMRQEVVEQHLREQGRPIPRPRSAGISSEFLEALPPEIREEVLAEERLEQRVREIEDRQRNRRTLDAVAPGEMDPATFLANMDPELRGAMLMGSDDMFLASLPPDLVAQAENLRTPRRTHAHRRLAGQASAVDAASGKKTPAPTREPVQLVDREGLVTLVRLLFLPQPPQKPLLHKLLLNLCENRRTRSELMSLLLSIVQDGGADFSAVDRIFSQMSVRGKAHSTPGKPAAPGKRYSSLSDGDAGPTEGIPNLVTQRCLEAVSYLVTYNEQTTKYFLKENENVPIRRSNSKKGKGKEKAPAAAAAAGNRYPIAVLLGLLERQSFPGNSALMEQLMHLLSTICRLLPSIAKQEAEDAKSAAGAAASAAAEPASCSDADESKPAPGGGETPAAPKTPGKSEDDAAPLRLPVIPEYCLKLVVNALTEGECTSKTFQCTLAVIQNLSVLPGAKEKITAELTHRAQALGDSVKQDLVHLRKLLGKASSGIDVQGTVLNKFTPASSDQAKLLRVLKTIDYMYFPKPGSPTTPRPMLVTPAAPAAPASGSPSDAPAATAAAPAAGKESEPEKMPEEQRASKIYEALSFYNMWKHLGDCMSLIHKKEDLMHVATVLLPIMESFMVMHKHISFKNAATMQRNASRIHLIGREASGSPEPEDSPNAERLFFQFTEDHRKILNAMVRKNPSLMSGSFSLLVHNPNVLEFENKRNYFNQQLHKRGSNREHYGTIQLNVRRQFVFEDSFHQLQGHTGNEVKHGKLSVRFYDEEGVDAGGVSREWFQVLARQMFNPDYALFISSAVKKVTYQPNRYSYFNPEHLLYFRFVGRIVGKAIFDGKLLDCYFTRSLYKHILGKPVDYRDVEALDPAYYQSLEWMLNNDITDVIDLTMTVEETEFGKEEIIELVPGGANIPVTEENKREYIRLVSEHKLTKAIKDQIAAFKEGFHEIVPGDLVSIFDPEQLELMISGMPDINVEDWKANTEYEGYTSSSPQIQWFWRAVRLFEQEEKAKVGHFTSVLVAPVGNTMWFLTSLGPFHFQLLQFVTGTSRVPLEGFASLQGMSGVQKFSIRMDPSSPSRLPSAHTCFNSMDLPQYESYEQLRKQLLLAITEASFGFSFA